jgi:hypothetical protein
MFSFSSFSETTRTFTFLGRMRGNIDCSKVSFVMKQDLFFKPNGHDAYVAILPS